MTAEELGQLQNSHGAARHVGDKQKTFSRRTASRTSPTPQTCCRHLQTIPGPSTKSGGIWTPGITTWRGYLWTPLDVGPGTAGRNLHTDRPRHRCAASWTGSGARPISAVQKGRFGSKDPLVLTEDVDRVDVAKKEGT